MRQYLNALRDIMLNGVDREGRNGFTRALWAMQLRFDLREGFPAVTTKKLAFKSVLGELLWFLEGGTRNGRADNNRLKEIMGQERTIWTGNAESSYWKPRATFPGDLGRIYGVQWRSWRSSYGAVDQVAEAIKKLREDPHDRRIMVTTFNPGELDEMALPPCHMFFHFFVADGWLSTHMVQRSCDMFLGVPFNIASYALLTHMVAQVVGLKPHELVISLDDAHVYHDHFDAVREQLLRKPHAKPRLRINTSVRGIDDFTMEDFSLENYVHDPPIKAKMAV